VLAAHRCLFVLNGKAIGSCTVLRESAFARRPESCSPCSPYVSRELGKVYRLACRAQARAESIKSESICAGSLLSHRNVEDNLLVSRPNIVIMR